MEKMYTTDKIKVYKKCPNCNNYHIECFEMTLTSNDLPLCLSLSDWETIKVDFDKTFSKIFGEQVYSNLILESAPLQESNEIMVAEIFVFSPGNMEKGIYPISLTLSGVGLALPLDEWNKKRNELEKTFIALYDVESVVVVFDFEQDKILPEIDNDVKLIQLHFVLNAF